MRCFSAPLSLFLSGLLVYCSVLLPMSAYMRSKPIEEKLGFVPSIKLIVPLSADQKELMGASLVMKVLMYFGGKMGGVHQGRVLSEPLDMPGMSRLLHAAVKLDPYNMDAYYFAQGFLTWDAKQFKVANDLLDYGMKYRTWDWYIPFFACFNHAYFLNDSTKAAYYYERAARLSKNNLHIQLTGRYMQEAGQTDLAIMYLAAMVKNEIHPVLKKEYQIRLTAFQEVRRIERAQTEYVTLFGMTATSIGQLVQAGLLQSLPVDPYGGTFYIDPGGKVATTSKFAFASKDK